MGPPRPSLWELGIVSPKASEHLFKVLFFKQMSPKNAQLLVVALLVQPHGV